MKSFIVCTFAALLSGALAAPQDLTSKWEEFKAEHGKQHPSHEEAKRMQRFAERHAEIEAHNARYALGLESFSRQLNQYSDLSDEELDKYAFGFISGVGEAPVFWNNSNVLPSLPVSYDWKEKGAMTPAKDQKYCGACYAFTAAALLESYLKRKTKKEYDLSEQDIIDCSYKKIHNNQLNLGCNGGAPLAAFMYLQQNGVAFELCYPFTSGKDKIHHTCRSDRRDSHLVDKRLNLTCVNLEDEDKLAELLVTKGPLVVSIGLDKKLIRELSELRDGIFDVPNTSDMEPNHAVVLVGYGIKKGKRFWNIKNSWGTKWGVKGYGKLARGKNIVNIVRPGACYIEEL